jgi:hypothetical protein
MPSPAKYLNTRSFQNTPLFSQLRIHSKCQSMDSVSTKWTLARVTLLARNDEKNNLATIAQRMLWLLRATGFCLSLFCLGCTSCSNPQADRFPHATVGYGDVVLPQTGAC